MDKNIILTNGEGENPSPEVENKNYDYQLEVKVPDPKDPTKTTTKILRLNYETNLYNLPLIFLPKDQFPEQGLENKLYVDTIDFLIYVYIPAENKYKPISGAGGSGTIMYKGTLGSAADGATINELPPASKETWGFAYKVVTAREYAGKNTKKGDLFICASPEEGKFEWTIIPAGDDLEYRPIALDGVEFLENNDGNALNFVNYKGTPVIIKKNGSNYLEFDLKLNFEHSQKDKSYGVRANKEGNLFVNVPWENTESPGYGQISIRPASSSSQSIISPAVPMTLESVNPNELLNISAGNKWIVINGENGTAGTDKIIFGHKVVGAKTNIGKAINLSFENDRNNKVSFTTIQLEIDEAGHVTASKDATVELPGLVSEKNDGFVRRCDTLNSFLMRKGNSSNPGWDTILVIDGGSGNLETDTDQSTDDKTWGQLRESAKEPIA